MKRRPGVLIDPKEKKSSVLILEAEKSGIKKLKNKFSE